MRYVDSVGKLGRYLDRLAAWDEGHTPAPVSIEWDLSNRCGLGCQDCHFAHTHVRGPWAVRNRVFPTAFSQTGDLADPTLVESGLYDAAALGVRSVVWSGGGEPTTHPAWTRLVRAAADAGLVQGMYTYGGLLTDESAEALRAVASWVVVSLDAVDRPRYLAEKGVDGFDAALRGVERLVGGSATVGVSFLLHGGNWTSARDMLAVARGHGASYATFRPAIRTSPAHPSACTDDRAWITDALPVLCGLASEPDVEIDPARFVAYRDWQGHGYLSCRGPRLSTTITPDGRVWVCPQHRGIPGSCLGDLRHQTFAEVWSAHPGSYRVGLSCRVMCRLHQVNQALEAWRVPRPHEEFV